MYGYPYLVDYGTFEWNLSLVVEYDLLELPNPYLLKYVALDVLSRGNEK